MSTAYWGDAKDHGVSLKGITTVVRTMISHNLCQNINILSTSI